VIVGCGFVPLARAPLDSERVLVAQCAAHEATPSGAKTGRESGRSYGGQRPGSPRRSAPDRPAPDHLPQVPTTPGSSLGSGSSGGFQSGAFLGAIAAPLSVTPFGGGRLVTLVEQRPRALPLVFLLERPG